MRACIYCRQLLDTKDLLEMESRDMEAARNSLGLEGVLFRYYTCPRCGHDSLYLELGQLPGEIREDVERRKEAIARVIEDIQFERTSVVLVETGG